MSKGGSKLKGKKRPREKNGEKNRDKSNLKWRGSRDERILPASAYLLSEVVVVEKL